MAKKQDGFKSTAKPEEIPAAISPETEALNAYQEREKKAEALKAKFKVEGVHRFTTMTKDGEEIECWCKEPGFAEVGVYMSMINRDPVKAFKALFINTWLEGDTQLQTNIHYFTSLIPQIEKMVEVRASTSEKF